MRASLNYKKDLKTIDSLSPNNALLNAFCKYSKNHTQNL